MGSLSHMQILDAITEIANKVVPVLLENEAVIHADSTEDAERQIREAIIVVMNHDGMPALELSTLKGVEWPDLFGLADPHYLRVFITLVRAIYN